MARVYHFELPYKILSAYLKYGHDALTSAGLFQRLPADLQSKWLRAQELEHDLRVSEDDLDRIDDHTWTQIADKLDLRWERRA